MRDVLAKIHLTIRALRGRILASLLLLGHGIKTTMLDNFMRMVHDVCEKSRLHSVETSSYIT